MVSKKAGLSFIACGMTSRSATMPAPMTSICGQRRRRVQDPERGVVEVPAGDEPLVRLVDGRERSGRRAQELDLLVARAELAQPFAQPGDRLVVGVEQPALGEQRVHERVLDRSLDRPPELGARNQESRAR